MMEEKRFNKYLIILGSLTVAILVIIIGYSFLTAPSYQPKGLNVKPIMIQWKTLQLPQLNQLTDFPVITSPTQPMGRDNPLIMGNQTAKTQPSNTK